MTRPYSINRLLLAVQQLPAALPLSDRLHKSGYDSHRDHWVGWLSEYGTEGFYDRSDTTVTDAQTVYQRLNCAPMMIWLAESLGLPGPTVRQAISVHQSLTAEGKNEAAKAAAVRRLIPWSVIEEYLKYL